MHKLFWVDIALVMATFLGLYYLYNNMQITLIYAQLIFGIYFASKVLGYIILKYENFEIFVNHLSKESQLKYLSGFEIFKTILVVLLFLGFLFVNPFIWIIESFLVVSMRIWGLAYIKNRNGV